MLKGAIPYYQTISEQSAALNYNFDYFNTQLTLEKFLESYPSELIETEETTINSDAIKLLLEQSTHQNWLFSGGGIIKKMIFDAGKNLIHIHPGILPAYRGSTTFYYSLVEKGYVGASAFFMKEEIDAGDVIDELQFYINMKIDTTNALFMDYILDPYIRGEVLKKVLLQLMSDTPFTTRTLELLEKAPYYIAHPFIRHLAVQKVNSMFNPNQPTGVFIKEGLHA